MCVARSTIPVISVIVVTLLLFGRSAGYAPSSDNQCEESELARCVCKTNTLNEVLSVVCVNQSFTNYRALAQLPVHIKDLTFRGNNLGALGDNIFGDQERNDFTSIDLSRNKITLIDGQSFHKVSSVESLDLSYNNWAPASAYRVFSNFDSLLTLNLTASLKRMFNETHKHVAKLMNIFAQSNLSNLQTLDLRDNNIIFIDEKFTCNLPLLKTFILDNNDLLDFKLNHSCAQYLETLSLRTNGLNRVSNETLTEILKLRNLKHLDLSDNTWHCDCKLKEFITFLKTDESKRFIDDSVRNEMVCKDVNQKLDGRKLVELEDSDLEECNYYSDDMKKSLRTSYIIIGIIFAILAVLFVVVLVLNRSKIKGRFLQISAPLRERAFGHANSGYSSVNI